jgi:hypothetical protein
MSKIRHLSWGALGITMMGFALLLGTQGRPPALAPQPSVQPSESVQRAADQQADTRTPTEGVMSGERSARTATISEFAAATP